MRSQRVPHGSFRAQMEDMAPLLGIEFSSLGQSPADTPNVMVGPRGSPAYLINQYLFEGSRH